MTDPSHFALVAMQLVRGKVTPFLGAGVNLCDREKDEAWEIGRNLPSGRELALHLAKSYQYPDQDTDLLRISQYVGAALGEGALYNELRTLFAAKIAPTSLHAFLAEMSPVLQRAKVRQQVLVTTNYDDLLEDAFAAAGVEFDLIWYEAKSRDPNRGRFFHRGPDGEVSLIGRPNEWSGIDLRQRPAILKLHGAIGEGPDEDSFVITEDDYIDYMTLSDVSTQIPMVLQDPLRNSHFVFMGYSLRDWNLRVVLNRLWGQQELALNSWSVQLGATALDQKLWQKRGTVEIIPDNLSTYIAELRTAVDACVAALPRRTVSSQAGPTGPRDSPYKGLVPYSEEDWPFFFGRSAEIRVIASNLRATRLTLLYGPSGVGKSSVLRAGVVHHLHEIATEDEALSARLAPVSGDPEVARRELAVTVFRSWRDPPLVPLMESIRLSARGGAGVGDLPAWFPGTSVVETLRGWTESVRTLLVILDQFEDYFLYHPEGAPDGGFAAELARILTTPDLRVNVLLSIREDALAKIDRFKGRIPGLYDNYLRIEHLGPAEAREAITAPVEEHNRRRPGGAAPVEIEDGLIGAVLGAGELRAGEAAVDRRAMAQPAAAAPAGERYETSFLQLVMSRLWAVETGRGSSVLRLGTLRELGGPQAIIEGHLQSAMEALSDDERRIAAAMFGYLVTPSKTKIAHTAADLAAWSQVPEAEAEAVLQRLCGGDRILRAVDPLRSTGGASPRRYEIFHDVLADAILDWRSRYEQRAREAGQLAEAREAAEREHRRVVRARIVAAGVGLLALVFALLAILAVESRNDARDQREVSRSVSLAARASEVFDSDPELSLLLALRATDAAETPQADQALRQATNDVRLRTLIEAGRGGAVVRAAVLSPAGDRIVTGGDDGRVIAWDPRTGGEQRVLVASGPRLNDVALSADGSLVATADTRGAVRVRDARDGRELAGLTAGAEAVNSVAFGPGGRVVASAGADGQVHRWDWRNARELLPALGEAGGPKVWRVAVSPDGTTIASASDDGRVRLWDARTGAPRPLEAGPHTGPAYAVAFSPDGRRMASGGEDGTVRVYRLPAGEPARIFRYQRGFVTDVSFSRGSRLLASAGLDGTIVVQDVDAGRALATLAGHRGSVRRARFSPDRLQVASAGADGTARIWDWGGNAIPIPAHGGPSRSVALAPDGTAVTLGADPTPEGSRAVARTWPGAAGGIGQQARDESTVDDPLGAAAQGGVAVVGDDAIAIGAGTTALVVRRDDPAAATPLALQRRALVSAVAASPEGRTIATTTVDGHLLLWRWPGGEPQGEIPAEGEPAGVGRTRAAFFPDGATLVTGDARGNLRLWDLATRRLVREAPLAGRFIVDVAVSPDGRLIAAATEEGVVRLRDARTLEEVRALIGHRGPVAAVAFGTLGGRPILATGGSDGTVRVWDVRGGAGLVTFQGQQGVVRDVAVTADGGTVASVADDGTLVFWPCEVCGTIDEVRRTARERVTRRLTPLEESIYLRGG